MDIEEKKFKIDEIASNWREHTLGTNPEYQRGLVWSQIQKQRLIDSVFRKYPLPTFYFREKTTTGLGGRPMTSFDIIDGQQRIEAFAGFKYDEWKTLKMDDSKLSLPDGIKSQPSPWGGRLYNELSASEQSLFNQTELTCIIVKNVQHDDEIRDLFIRLQAGTPLSRQEVRDAWPGPIGPFIDTLAGRKNKQPSIDLFNWVDRRGRKKGEDDESDDFVDDRQTCAQLLTLYYHRKEKHNSMPSLSSKTLDDLYHSRTSFDRNGEDARSFKEILAHCEKVIENKKNLKESAVRKNMLFSLFTFIFELSGRSDVKVNEYLTTELSKHFWSNMGNVDNPEPKGGRVVSSTRLKDHYQWFLEVKLKDLIIPGLDPERLFSDEKKDEIWDRSYDTAKKQHLCAICQSELERDDAEFDHILPWIRGGRTIVENGRAVHRKCHARGRAAVEFD
ncbi:MAG: HNH endonuclease family protein [Thermoplasmataceae archaeon]